MKAVFLAVPVLVAAGIVACAPVPPPGPKTAQAQAKLDRYLAGKVAGPPQTCIQPYQAGETITIDDNTILFKRGSTIYRNDPPGGCNGMGSGFYTLVTRSTGSGLCSGEIATVADVRSGVTMGSCPLGQFVPYKPAP
ncbi:hypothetical protein H8M03_06695 [Sphingomonas sabuli]|uniref:Lipoprotein n=1 Tax=Sphingomonas sabuli TaxID=2764186 RepID=A0A7G9KZF8_9SPHN|nr:hypothetical protein [Sphingomonas sabuli]QNM81757.1 hypothetical protein H8M03_06695 [Sphingomonas sabuli]